MAYDGQLNTNKVFASLFNMIISLQVFSAGITDLGGIYEARKVDGTLYGDTKLYISTDALKTYPWDGTDTTGDYNLLTVKRPPAPVQEKITIDIFRQIPVTVDEYLTKQAFLDEGSFGSFNGVILSWLQITKAVYEHTTFTANIIVSGQAKATALASIALYAPDAGFTGRDLLVYKAQELYRQIEDQVKELNEPSRAYNDNDFLRNYHLEDFDIVVPLGVLSSVRKMDVPFLFSPDEKPIFKEVHWKYFGAINATGATMTGTNSTVRALVEKDYSVGSPAVITHCFPGDLLPSLATYLADETYTATYTARPSINDDVTILLIHKQDYPIMSAFSVGTSFFNARRLDMNHYLTFGHNEVYDAHLGERALLKVATVNTDPAPAPAP